MDLGKIIEKYHPNDFVCDGFYAMDIKRKYSDIKYKIGDKIINCNKIILATASEYFKLTFDECVVGEIEVLDEDSKTMDLIFNYIYNKNITIPSKSLIDILLLADKYLLGKLSDVTTHMVIELLGLMTIDELTLLYQMSDKYNNRKIKNEVLKHFSMLMNTIIKYNIT